MTQRDESLPGGKYHGPSNEPGLTSREYQEMLEEEQWEEWDRVERMRDDRWEDG